MTDFIIRHVRFAHLYLVRKTSFVFIDMKKQVTQETCTTVVVITYLNRESPVLGFRDS